MALCNGLMQERLARENTMFQTRNVALGNSKTPKILRTMCALELIRPSSGMFCPVTGRRSALGLVERKNMLTGNTAEVREAVANILLAARTEHQPAALQRMLDEAVQRIQIVQQIARTVGRGASGGLAVAPSATGNRR